MEKNKLEMEIKQLIISALDLEDIEVEDIKSDEPLFVEGLGLDSIDALELGMALRRKYKVSFTTDKKENTKHFYSVEKLADYISNELNNKE